MLQNWFSVDSTVAIYNGFLDLDIDMSGMLNEMEMSKFRGCGLTNTLRRDMSIQFTPLAISRIFQENVTYEPSTELDYKRYVDCILAVENRGTPQSAQVIIINEICFYFLFFNIDFLFIYLYVVKI